MEVISSLSCGQTGEAGLDQPLRRRVEDEVCKLGGDAVSFAMSSQTQGFSGSGASTGLMLLRSKVQAAPKPKTEQL